MSDSDRGGFSVETRRRISECAEKNNTDADDLEKFIISIVGSGIEDFCNSFGWASASMASAIKRIETVYMDVLKMSNKNSDPQIILNRTMLEALVDLADEVLTHVGSDSAPGIEIIPDKDDVNYLRLKPEA